VVILGLNSRFIDTQDVTLDLWYRVAFVYGEPRTGNRHHMWELLRRLHTVSNLPWMVVGNFNECMWGFEHFSSHPRLTRQMNEFGDALDHYGLIDLGFCGAPYTYDNGRGGYANMRVRLERVVATVAWRDMFNDAKVSHIVYSCSDHYPVYVELRKDVWVSKGRELLGIK
jgi:hypothetical protein